MAKKRTATVQSVQSIRDVLRQAAEQSGLTQEEIGIRMGFSQDGARKAVSRLLNPEIEYDPRISTLLKFADALGLTLKDLL